MSELFYLISQETKKAVYLGEEKNGKPYINHIELTHLVEFLQNHRGKPVFFISDDDKLAHLLDEPDFDIIN